MTWSGATTNQNALSCIALYMLYYIELYCTFKFSGYITTLGYTVMLYITPSLSSLYWTNVITYRVVVVVWFLKIMIPSQSKLFNYGLYWTGPGCGLTTYSQNGPRTKQTNKIRLNQKTRKLLIQIKKTKMDTKPNPAETCDFLPSYVKKIKP